MDMKSKILLNKRQNDSISFDLQRVNNLTH